MLHLNHHADCPDGFLAAVLMRRYLEKTQPGAIIQTHACQYGRPLPLQPEDTQPEDTIIFVDYTPEHDQGGADVLTRFATGRFLEVYDHHETAFWNPAKGAEPAKPGPLLEFMIRSRENPPLYTPKIHYSPSATNNEGHQVKAHTMAGWNLDLPAQSGVGLVCAQTFGGLRGYSGGIWNWVPKLVQFRDLGYAWTWADDPEFRDQCEESLNLHAAIMRTIPRTFEAWSPLLDLLSTDDRAQELLQIGANLRRTDETILTALARASTMITIGGHLVPVGENIFSELKNDLAHLLLRIHPSAPFAAVRRVDSTSGKMLYSLRGRPGPDQVNVGTIAYSYGGGGHAQAASFSTLEPL